MTQTDDNQMRADVIAQPVSALGAAAATYAALVVRRGPDAGSQFRLDQPVTSAGRHPDNNIVVDDITVSHRHAEFHCKRGEFRIVDVGSLNGTYVNGEPIRSAALTNGDDIRMGRFRLMFLARPEMGWYGAGKG